MSENLRNKLLYAVVASRYETGCKIITDTADEDLNLRDFMLYFLTYTIPDNNKNIKICFREYG